MLQRSAHAFPRKGDADGRASPLYSRRDHPGHAFGYTLKKLNVPDLERNIAVVAWNTVIYGVLMLDRRHVQDGRRKVNDMTLKSAFIIGCAQALALIPGTSRSGVTMTAARFLGFHPLRCARFSFLLGIPAIAAAVVLKLARRIRKRRCHIACDEVAGRWADLRRRNLAAIAFFMDAASAHELVPFVLYRMALGGFLLVLVYGYGAYLPPAPEGSCGPGQPAIEQSAPAPQ